MPDKQVIVTLEARSEEFVKRNIEIARKSGASMIIFEKFRRNQSLDRFLSIVTSDREAVTTGFIGIRLRLDDLGGLPGRDPLGPVHLWVDMDSLHREVAETLKEHLEALRSDILSGKVFISTDEEWELVDAALFVRGMVDFVDDLGLSGLIDHMVVSPRSVGKYLDTSLPERIARMQQMFIRVDEEDTEYVVSGYLENGSGLIMTRRKRGRDAHDLQPEVIRNMVLSGGAPRPLERLLASGEEAGIHPDSARRLILSEDIDGKTWSVEYSLRKKNIDRPLIGSGRLAQIFGDIMVALPMHGFRLDDYHEAVLGILSSLRRFIGGGKGRGSTLPMDPDPTRPEEFRLPFNLIPSPDRGESTDELWVFPVMLRSRHPCYPYASLSSEEIGIADCQRIWETEVTDTGCSNISDNLMEALDSIRTGGHKVVRVWMPDTGIEAFQTPWEPFVRRVLDMRARSGKHVRLKLNGKEVRQ